MKLTLTLILALVISLAGAQDFNRPEGARTWLVKFRPNVGLLARYALIQANGFEVGRIEKLKIHRVVNRNPESLRQMSGVEWVEEDKTVRPAQTNDPAWTNTAYYWWPHSARLPEAWQLSTGSNVIIAILDTGVANHPDLAQVPGWNVYAGTSDTSDVYGHGTGVAGMAAAVGNNGIGLAGAAHQALIMPVKVSSDSASATFSTLAAGLVYAADNGAKVANLSWSNTHLSLAVSEAAAYAASKGVVVTTASGNAEPTYRMSAPNNPYLLNVGATTQEDVIATFSVYGPSLDVSAPGQYVRTTMTTGYGNDSGTSAAAPLVAGVAALIIAKYPSLSPSQVQWAITQSATDKGPLGWDEVYGWGRVDARRALEIAGDAPQGPPPDTQPPFVQITSPADGSTVKGNVSVKVTATDNVSVASVKFYLNGTLRGTLSAEPYTWNVSAKQFRRGENVILATARDSSGNEASHSVRVFRA